MLYELFNFYLWIENNWTPPCFSSEAYLCQAGPVNTEVPPAVTARQGGKNKTKQNNCTYETRKEMIVEACSAFFPEAQSPLF